MSGGNQNRGGLGGSGGSGGFGATAGGYRGQRSAGPGVGAGQMTRKEPVAGPSGPSGAPNQAMEGIRRMENDAKRRRIDHEGEGSNINQGNGRGSGGRVILQLPTMKGHQSVESQLKSMNRIEQSPGYQQAQERWTGQYYDQEFPEFQPMRHPGQQVQGAPPQLQHHQFQQGHFPQHQQQYPHHQNFPVQYPLRGPGGEEFNLYTNMERNDRSWPYNSNRGRWN